jgi:hypothetical protein
MLKKVITLFCITFLFISHLHALERPDKEFKIFQFPPNMIPRIDGNIDDWNMVPISYAIGTEELSETELGKGPNHDLNDLDVKVRVGWVKGLNRLYFCYEAYDDYWNMYYTRGDIFEVVVDADLSGGKFIRNDQLSTWEDSHFKFKGVHAQNYHIFTPPGEGRDWAMVWGCQPWIAELPYSNHAYNYNFKEGESGKLILECWITPFDYAPYEGPERAVESKLVEDTIIGLSWAIMDYEENNKYDGFWNLSHKTSMDSNASSQVAFRLMPVEQQFLPALSAQWSFKVVDMSRRLVSFKDLSHGEITSWLWDFGDGTTSSEQHPIHRFQKAGDFVIVLNVEGPAGKARRVKVRNVAVK